jgi:hypothetical protein
MGDLARALKQAFGPRRLSRLEIAIRQREAERAAQAREAAEIAASLARARQEIEDFLEELRRRAEEEDEARRRRRSRGTFTAWRGAAAYATARAAGDLNFAVPMRPAPNRRRPPRQIGR